MIGWVVLGTLTQKSAKVGSNKYKPHLANSAVSDRRIEVVVSKMEITSHTFFISDINDFVAHLFCALYYPLNINPGVFKLKRLRNRESRDLTFFQSEDAHHLQEKLPGQKFLIQRNHDGSIRAYSNYFKFTNTQDKTIARK